MARRLHHIEIIPGKNGHKVRHFHAANEGGAPAYQCESHVFGNAEDVANHIEDVLEKHEEENEPKGAAKTEEPQGASEADVVDAGKAKAEKAAWRR